MISQLALVRSIALSRKAVGAVVRVEGAAPAMSARALSRLSSIISLYAITNYEYRNPGPRAKERPLKGWAYRPGCATAALYLCAGRARSRLSREAWAARGT